MLVSRAAVAIGFLLLVLGGVTQPASANMIFLRGAHEHAGGGGGGSTPLSAALTITPDAANFILDCANAFSSIGPAYPPQWDWDPAATLGVQPQSATEAMVGLTPKIEQYRGGVLVATWSKFSSTDPCLVPNRALTPGSVDSLACLGPFQQNVQGAWLAGDTFLVYPAVYKESVYIGPLDYLFPTANVSIGDTHITFTGGFNTTAVRAGDAIYRSTYFSPDTHIISVDSSTQITISKPVIANGTGISMELERSMQNVTIQGVTQNVGGVPTRPTLLFDDTVDLTEGSNKGMVAGGFGNTDADIKNFMWDNIDVVVKKPPYGKRTYVGPNVPFGLVYLSGTELQGNVKFSHMRAIGGIYINWPLGADGFLSGNIGANRRNSGDLIIDQVELFQNGGGPDGPNHNAYFGDGFYRLIFTNNWSHGASFGHNLKTRSMNSVIVGNYLEGGHGLPPYTSDGESNVVDAPCGGSLTLDNNVITKQFNGGSQNPYMVEYFEDGTCSSELGGPFQWTDMEGGHFEMNNNIFVAFSRKSAGGQVGNANSPFLSYGRHPRPRPQAFPEDPMFATTDVTVTNNVYVGFCPQGINTAGELYPWATGHESTIGKHITAGFADLNEDFSLRTPYVPLGDTTVIGTSSYTHEVQPAGTRALATFGAMDYNAAATPAPASKPSVLLYEGTDHYQLGLGQSAHLYWGVTGANSCTASGAWSGSKVTPSGSEIVTVSASVAAPVTYTLACAGPSGTSTASVVLEVFDNPVLSSFTANRTTTTNPGDPATFTWTSANTDHCDFSDGFIGQNHSNGSAVLRPTQTVTVSMGCLGAGGRTARQHILVQVGATLELPTVYFWSDNTFLVTSSDLHWESNGSTSCTGTNFSTGGATSGTVTVTPTPPSTVYQIQCTGPGGTSAQPYIQVFTP